MDLITRYNRLRPDQQIMFGRQVCAHALTMQQLCSTISAVASATAINGVLTLDSFLHIYEAVPSITPDPQPVEA